VDTPDLAVLLFDDFRQGRAVWYRYVAPFSGDFNFQITTSNWDGAIGVFSGTALDTLEVALDFSDDPAVDNFGWGVNDLSVRLTAGETYYLLLVGIGWSNSQSWDDLSNYAWASDMIPQGSFSLSWSGVNAGDVMEDAFGGETFSNLGYFESYFYEGQEWGPVWSNPAGGCRISSNIGATAEVGEMQHTPGTPTENSVWFFLSPGAGGTYQFWVEPTGDTPMQDPILAIYNYNYAETFASISPAIATSDNFDDLYPRLNAQLFAFNYYLIAVDGRDQGTFELNFKRVPLTSPPVNDDFVDAITIVEEDTINGTTVGATVECGETPQANWYEGPFGSVWYRFNPTASGTAFLQLTAPSHPEGAYVIVDVFQGTTLENLVNITPADTYFNGAENETTGFPFSYLGGTPVYIRLASYEDGSPYDEGDGGTFSFILDVGSTTPPTGDDSDESITSGAGTTAGNTDGATLEPGEADPNGGVLTQGGTVWHKYVSPAPGFVDIYTTRTGPSSEWYRVGVYEGATLAGALSVRAVAQKPPIPSLPAGGHQCHFEVREGQTYWIQVVRNGDQSWGAYDLHIDEYLEYNDWALGVDGFTSTTNSPVVSGDTITCTGSQPIADLLDVLPQYGTIDLGADTPKWGRETRIYFEVRLTGGQCLRREMWYGGDDWNFTNAASNDHIALTMRRLGLFRARDTAGVQQLVGSLSPGSKGENIIEATTATNACTSDTSLGVGGPQHEQGWVGVELIINSNVVINNDGTGAVDPTWTMQMIVDGEPVNDSCSYIGRQLRYFDFGMYRHPSMILANDQYYAENNEAWTYEMRRIRVTNIVPRNPYGVDFAGDLGIFHFDGFPSGIGWRSDNPRYIATTTPGGYWPDGLTNIVGAPNRPGRYAFRSTLPGTQLAVNYGFSTGSRRIYGFSLHAAAMPVSGKDIAFYQGFTSYQGGIARFRLASDGELTIMPFGREFCVAHLQTDEWYWIEVHVNAEVMWDVRCTVYINGHPFGTYSNAYTYTEVASGLSSAGVSPAIYNGYSTVSFSSAGTINHDLYFSDIVIGLGNPGAVFGPLKSIAVSGVNGVLGHNLPDEPIDTMILEHNDGSHKATLYDWMYEALNPGPLTSVVEADGETLASMSLIGPRFWEAYFTLRPTCAWSEESLGSNAWSPIGQGRTRIGDAAAVSASAGPTATLKLTNFGQSVPVDATVTGIDVRVHRRGSGSVSDNLVQLYKAGSLVGSNLGGGSWSSTYEVAVYGGPANMWGTSWTPQEINASGFGVGIQAQGGGTAEIDMVTIRVYFADQGAPSNISRGTILSPTGLYNLYGDVVVVEFDYSGTASGGVSWPTGGWEPTFINGGTASHKWSGLNPLWLWQARGDKVPYFRVTGTPGLSGTATNMRIIRNPLSYPRYAWSADNGASWTWIYPGENDSENHIGGDVGALTYDAIFIDNCAAVDRWLASKGGWDSGLTQSRPTCSPAYRYPYYYLGYTCGTTAETTIHATNLWARWRAYANTPSTAGVQNGNFRVHAALDNGGVRKVARFGVNYLSSLSPVFTAADPLRTRATMPRAPDGTAWTQDKFNTLQLRLGLNDNSSSNTFSISSNPSLGAAVYSLTWEILVSDDPSPPPQACDQLIDLSMTRFVGGSGTADGGGPGIDLSDAKFTLGSGEEVGGSTGLDISDVLFSQGTAPEEV
jgi:hypothetical protein